MTTSSLAELKALADDIRGKRKGAYDCIIGGSGGLDSSYVIYVAKRLLGLNPLVVTYDHGFFHDHARQNLRRIEEVLDVDLQEMRSSGGYDRKYVGAIVRALRPLNAYWGVCSFCHFVLSAARNKCAHSNCISTMLSSSNVYESLHVEQRVKVEFMKRRFLNIGLRHIPVTAFWLMLAGYWLMRLRAEFYAPPIRNLFARSGVPPWLRSINVTKYIPWDIDHMVETLRREAGWRLPEHPNIMMRFDCIIEEGLLNHTYKQATGSTVHSIIANHLIYGGVRTRSQLEGAVQYYDNNIAHQTQEAFARLERSAPSRVVEVSQ